MTESRQDHKDGVPREQRQDSAIALEKPKGKDDMVDVYSVSETQSTLEQPSSSSSKSRGFRSLFHRKSDSGEPKEPKRKEKRESISDRGAFRIEYRNGVPIAVENTDWPPGVSYEKTSLRKLLESKDGTLGEFYSGQGAIVAGGENAGNTGPDPDWVPGLTEEERKKLRSSKSGRYVF